MRRSTVALVALLAISAALNVLLLARGRSEPPRPPAERPRAAREVEAPPADASLARQVETLEARIRELETDKRLLIDGFAAGPDRQTVLRETLRRLRKARTDPGGWLDPQAQLDYEEASLMVQKVILAREKDPKAYLEFLRLVFDQAMEDPPLAETQREEVRRILGELESSFAAAKADGAGERLLRELAAESAALERLGQVIGPERADDLHNSLPACWAWGGSMKVHLGEQARDEVILEHWGHAYGLDAAQTEAARMAARVFAAELDRLARVHPTAFFLSGGSPQSLRARHDALQVQLNALRPYEASWSREQRERFRTRTPLEFAIPRPGFPVLTGEEENR